MYRTVPQYGGLRMASASSAPASATSNELLAILGISALIASILIYTQTPKAVNATKAAKETKAPKAAPTPQKAPVARKEPFVAAGHRPAQWELGGTAPGWTSGRWLGGGDFRHFWDAEHPFRKQPTYAGHPQGF